VSHHRFELLRKKLISRSRVSLETRSSKR